MTGLKSWWLKFKAEHIVDDHNKHHDPRCFMCNEYSCTGCPVVGKNFKGRKAQCTTTKRASR